jgi:hypothetical protein
MLAAIPKPVGPFILAFGLNSLGFSLTGQLYHNTTVRPVPAVTGYHSTLHCMCPGSRT